MPAVHKNIWSRVSWLDFRYVTVRKVVANLFLCTKLNAIPLIPPRRFSTQIIGGHKRLYNNLQPIRQGQGRKKNLAMRVGRKVSETWRWFKKTTRFWSNKFDRFVC